ncbi:MAG: exodeoxyribonuclease III [Mariprofundaceae bacterium]|nr:exodeoxyribonuclease III [Mariprofundaceae bacterium]
MRIVTWNVNSLNVRLPHVLNFLSKEQPDILALQETKVPDEKFPRAEIEAAGYHLIYSGQKTYNGVAILSKQQATDITTGIPDLDDPQRRLLAVTIDGVRIVNIYIPNGQEVGSEKYDYKFRWLSALRDYLKTELAQHERLIMLGDYNIAPADIDIYNPKRWRGKIMCSEPEREMFRSFLELGLTDSVRQLYPDEPMHSWWDYRLNAYKRGWGIRIDHILTTAALRLRAGGVYQAERGRERPSDHAPVWLEFKL